MLTNERLCIKHFRMAGYGKGSRMKMGIGNETFQSKM